MKVRAQKRKLNDERNKTPRQYQESGLDDPGFDELVAGLPSDLQELVNQQIQFYIEEIDQLQNNVAELIQEKRVIKMWLDYYMYN